MTCSNRSSRPSAALPDTSVQSHLEPREDPRAYADYANDTQPPTEPT